MRITCRNLSKSYAGRKDTIKALANTELDIRENEFVCIVGPSGCGKTTLLRLIAGLLEPTSGTVQIGERLSSDTNSLKPQCAMVFQEHGLFPWLSVVDNIAFGLEAHGVPRQRRRNAAREWLDRLGMSKFGGAYPHEISVGMRQRVALSRAFLTDAPVLLMDEPLASLDYQMRFIVQGELLAQWGEKRRTVVYVTHDLDEAFLLSDRILVMSRRPGRFLESHESPLPRPRSPHDLDRMEMIDLKWSVWKTIETEVRATMAEL